MYQLNDFSETTHPQNRQHIVLASNSKQQVDDRQHICLASNSKQYVGDFVGELTF